MVAWVGWWTEDFDAIVVAAGSYHTPHVPEIDGLVEWSRVRAVDDPSRWSVHHGRTYRRPERYAGKVRRCLCLFDDDPVNCLIRLS